MEIQLPLGHSLMYTCSGRRIRSNLLRTYEAMRDRRSDQADGGAWTSPQTGDAA